MVENEPEQQELNGISKELKLKNSTSNQAIRENLSNLKSFYFH